MASSGKKGKKSKGKTFALNDFLQETPGAPAVVAVKKYNWCDEVDETYESGYDSRPKTAAISLPTAPRAARGPEISDDRIPNHPPFMAYISNLPYDVNESDIADFFGNMQISNMRLPREGGEGGKLRGFGYVEFEDRNSLVEAISLLDINLKGRRIKIDVATNSDVEHRRGGRMDIGRDRPERPEVTMGDWRSGPRSDPVNESRRGGGGGGGGGGAGGFSRNMDRERDRDRDRDGPSDSNRSWRDMNDRPSARESSDRPSYRESRESSDRPSYRDSNRDSERGGYNRDRDRDRDGFSDRGRFADRERGEDSDWRGGGGAGSGRGEGGYSRRFGSDREGPERDGDFRRGNRDDGPPRDGEFRRGNRDDGPPAEKEQPRSRQKLNLVPRTKPIEASANEAPAETAAPTPVSGASIFGAAKPVDTSARERQIEERLAKEKESIRPPARDISKDNKSKEEGGDEKGPKREVWKSKRNDENSENSSRRESPDRRPSSKGPPLRRNDDKKFVGNKEKVLPKKDEKPKREERHPRENHEREMPKVREPEVPNFVASNLFAALEPDDDTLDD